MEAYKYSYEDFGMSVSYSTKKTSFSDWVFEEPNLVDVSDLNVEDDLGWESIDMSFGALNLNDDDDEAPLNDEDFVPNDRLGSILIQWYPSIVIELDFNFSSSFNFTCI
ncbi:hypothetical protein K2173_008109 [Erythroxylum novogranatense]|uniref:Uncharacterized protein n=1 Tax=Erythroxylum novogranatense TaxID=1862640 RepID=A0AAV8S9D4_9ROSI|nr:hypothetical protein K2173_008109 [Erythroxylum novogranatense]